MLSVTKCGSFTAAFAIVVHKAVPKRMAAVIFCLMIGVVGDPLLAVSGNIGIEVDFVSALSLALFGKVFRGYVELLEEQFAEV